MSQNIPIKINMYRGGGGGVNNSQKFTKFAIKT